ncbi:MAG TPA: PDZ domain-containing protein [Gemmatimonadales bacterium]|jgi:predicted metalloprotease with PDZ domain
MLTGKVALLFLLGMAGSAQAQRAAPAPAAPPRSAPLSNLRYEISFDSTLARRRTIQVSATFDVSGTGPILLSWPEWTPGAYEMSWYARWVSDFEATANNKPLPWDKLDYDTWRVRPEGAHTVTVRFNYLADSLDNAMAWARPDFSFFNGTNLFPYPEGQGTNFAATVTVKTQPDWQVATGMTPSQESRTYREVNYHDLVDRPFFVGRFDYDSMQVAGVWTRLATYPAGSVTGPTRAQLWEQIGKVIPAEAAVFGETPWPNYTIMMVFERGFGGGSALEHQNSHLGIYNPQFIGNAILSSITAHEIFHAWNVKRMRPAEMVPYRYDRMEPTPWLWVSEGITDYYADLALVRSGIIDTDQFLGVTANKIGTVAASPPTALEDGSLTTWIHPTDGSQYLYYQKGSLAGLMLDVMIRDASDNRHSLDDVMRDVYRSTYKKGRGFTGADWWGAVSRAAGGKSFADFNTRYVDGREPYPWLQVLPLAGLRPVTDTLREPRLGVASAQDSSGAIVVSAIQPGSMAQEAGVKAGDRLLALGDVSVTSPNFGEAYRSRFGKNEGDTMNIKVLRGRDTLTLKGRVRLGTRVEGRITVDSTASEKATRIRAGILEGKTDK